MPSDKYKQLAKKYYVDDITSALIPGGRLSNILKQLEDRKLLSDYTLQYLRSKGLLALSQYAQKKIFLADFLKSAKIEQAKRCLETKAKTVKEKAEKKLKEKDRLVKLKAAQKQAAAKKRAFDNNPKNIAKKKQDKLRRKYDLSFFIQRADFPKLMKILHQVDNGVRLSEDDILWLLTEEDGEYYTVKLKEGYHKNEAEFYVSEFKNRKNPWAAVNASSHYRKCNEAEAADLLLQTINIDKFKNVKLKSALCTTHGGAKRDLKQWKEALALGEQAHLLTPQNFRPCTQLGAINMEIGHYDLGQSWYKKAIARGYSARAMDNDLRSIFIRAEKKNKEKLKEYLLNIDSFRYRWVNEYKN